MAEHAEEALAARLVETYSDRLLRLAYSILNSVPDAQDVCQEVLLKRLEYPGAFENEKHEQAWMVRVTVNACKMPTEADELWIIAVSTAPASIPKSGFLNIMNMLRKAGTSASPATAPDIVSIPNISVAKPSRIVPVSFFLSVFPVIKRIIPINASTGVNDVGFKS